MQMNIQHKGDIAVINLMGKFDGGNDCKKFQEKISQLLAAGDRKFIFSFSLIRFISSCGLGRLLAIHQKVTAHGGRAILCNLENKPLSVIYVTRLHEVFEVRRNLRSALAEFETVGSETG